MKKSNKRRLDPERETIFIDGKNAILGRLATFSAKQTLLGKNVIIVNCNDVVISGRKRKIISEYREMRNKGSPSFRGPFFPKQSHRIVKRTIRGMLAHRQGRGRAAIRRVRCYDTVPAEYEKSKFLFFENKLKTTIIKLKDLSKEI